MHKKKRIKLWYLLLVAFIQFPLKLTGSFLYLTYVYVYLIPILYLFVNCKYIYELIKNDKSINIRFFEISYSFLLILSGIWPVICKTFDFSYITVYWLNMFEWVIKYMFLIIVFKKHIYSVSPIESFSAYFIGGVSLYAFTSLVSFAISPIRSLMLKIIYVTDQDMLNYQRPEYETRFGWSGWSSFNETTICTFAIIMACIFVIKNNGNLKKQKHGLATMLFPLIGNAMYGRIGLLASLICIGITCLMVFLKGNIRYVIRVLAIIVIILAIFIVLKDKIEVFQSWYSWIFSAFDNYKRTGKFYDNVGTVEHLTKDMYWMPERQTFLWGDGYYTGSDGAYYMHTDSGIMRPILYYGVLNYCISIIGIMCLVKKFAENIIENKHSKNVKLIVLLLIICIALFEFKGESLWMFVALLFPIILLEKRLMTNG